ncbi:hypothetical protein KSS87_008151 [Heliosperma pusillum]|nr:hypothetical protein KSS87_008151 [Heliosperma pusillum]
MGNDEALTRCLLSLAMVIIIVGFSTHSFKKMLVTYFVGLVGISGVLLPDWEFFDRDVSQWTRPVTVDGISPTDVLRRGSTRRSPVVTISAGLKPLDLTEENVETVLLDARAELAQLFDGSVGITGQAELAEVDGPYVKIRLKGKFWHTRSMVLARLENYLKLRIPEILEVDIEDEKMLDDSPANF